MFGLFGKKDPKEKIRKDYEKLLKESYELSHRDRAASDRKRAEAEELLKKLD
jgi:hypothetical protein